MVHKCCKDSLPPCMKVRIVSIIGVKSVFLTWPPSCVRSSETNLSFVQLRNFRISVQRLRRRAGQHRSLRVSLQHEILHPPVDVVGRSLCCPADFTVRDNSPQRAIPTDSLPAVSPKERKDPMTNSSSATGGFSHSDRSQSSPSL